MNREIKFRVWDIKDKKYHYNEQISISKYGSCSVLPDKNFLPEECVIQQFTGLKDKNGKEIYEGDIIIDVDLFKYVSFEYGKWIISYKRIEEDCGYFDELTNRAHYCKIVGNKFENPELLN